ncbi:hypothetical protein TrCOL_g4447 [Triparma columacea]|uniref:MULE transposase domain-containing protein n=1 Tax=Triparma columacea TaxID=722753 RepID=A0A9W7G8I5_9STRA|nr:hypothetical protein TrCOL_g4447 [Triparma columacea]
MSASALTTEVCKFFDAFFEHYTGCPIPPRVPTGTEMNPSQAAEREELRVSLYGRGGEFKGIMVVNVPPVIGATDAGVLYAHPSSLKANLPIGKEPYVSEALYDHVTEELMEDNEEAGSRRAALFQKKFKERKDLTNAIKWEGTHSGCTYVQAKGKSNDTRVVAFCANSVVNGKLDGKALCSAKIVARKKDGFWQVVPLLGQLTTVFEHHPLCTCKVKMTQHQLGDNYKTAVGSDGVVDTKANRAIQKKQGAGTRTPAERQKANRALNRVINDNKAKQDEEYCRLPSLVEYFNKKNKDEGSVAELKVDEYNQFLYLFFYLGPCADVLKKAGYPVLALDGTHIKHDNKGVILELVGRDTNDKLRTLAFMICRAEDGNNYERFATLCKNAGLDTLFGALLAGSGVEKVPVFCDRDQGMNFFFKQFGNSLVRLKCTWHLIRNIRHALRKNKGGGYFEDSDIWRIQGSRTVQEYNEAMSELYSKCPAAQVYLSNVDKKDWVNYAIWEEHKVFTLGLRSNQQVESINGANVENRKNSILSLVLDLLTTERDKLADIRKEVTNPNSNFIANNKLSTPSVEKKIGAQLHLAHHWRAHQTTDKIGTVKHHKKSGAGGFYTDTIVNLNNLIACDNPWCDHQKKHMTHCSHALAYLRDMDMLDWGVYVKDYIPAFMTIEEYIEAYSKVIIHPIVKDHLEPRVFEGPLPKPAGDEEGGEGGDEDADLMSLDGDVVEEEQEVEEGGDEDPDFMSMGSVMRVLVGEGFTYKKGDKGVGFYRDDEPEVDEEWMDELRRRGGVQQGSTTTTSSTTATSLTTTTSSTTMPVETVSPFAAAFGEFEAPVETVSPFAAVLNGFQAAFGGKPGETASKKPASTNGSSKAKARKATHPTVAPDVAWMAYGAPSVLPPPGPKPGPGKPQMKRWRGQGYGPKDGGTVFKLKPGNKEEPLVDATRRHTWRHNAGKNRRLDVGEWV